jgi:hypothetical protein
VTLGFVFYLRLPAGHTFFDRWGDHATGEIVQVKRLSVSGLEDRANRQLAHSFPVIFQCVGQLSHDRNGSRASPRFWWIDNAVPHAAVNAQFLSIEVRPTQAANLAFAESGVRGRQNHGTSRFIERRLHPRQFREIVGVGFRGLFRARDAYVLNRVDVVENSQALRLFQDARKKTLDAFE